MTNEQAIKSFVLENKNLKQAPNKFSEIMDRNNIAIDAIQKLEKIKEILESSSYEEDGKTYSYLHDADTKLKHLSEVVVNHE